MIDLSQIPILEPSGGLVGRCDWAESRELIERGEAVEVLSPSKKLRHVRLLQPVSPNSPLWRLVLRGVGQKHVVTKCRQARAQLHGRGVLHGGRDIGYENSDPDGVRSAFKIDEERRRQYVQYQIEPPTAVVEREIVQQDLRSRYRSNSKK